MRLGDRQGRVPLSGRLLWPILVNKRLLFYKEAKLWTLCARLLRGGRNPTAYLITITARVRPLGPEPFYLLI
jgi:hypothetical protein